MHSRVDRVIVALLIVCSAPREATSQPPLSRAGLRNEAVGCWVLLDSTLQSAASTLYWAPAITYLSPRPDSSRWANQGRPFRAASRLDESGRDLNALDDPRRRGLNAWSADSLSDSIRVIFTSGFSGTWFTFSIPSGTTADTLRGFAVERWDYKPDTQRGAAFAVRRRCA